MVMRKINPACIVQFVRFFEVQSLIIKYIYLFLLPLVHYCITSILSFCYEEYSKSSLIWIIVFIVVFIICLLTDISRYYDMTPIWIRIVISGTLVIYFAYYIIKLRRRKKNE